MGKNLTLLKYVRHAAHVASRPSPQALPSRRDRRRRETITDIKTAARVQLAQGGPAGISLRAIARQLGMTPSAVHYYFPSREALLDALIVDGWDSLAMTLRARYQQARPLPAHERWIAVTRAHRAWALEHPSEYLLLYGHTGLRVTPGADRSVQQAMSKVIAVLFTMMRDALAAGEIDAGRLQTATPPPLRHQLADWRETTGELAGLPGWRPSRLPDRIRPAPWGHHPGASRADPPSAPARRSVRPADGPRLGFPERSATSLVTQQATSPVLRHAWLSRNRAVSQG